LQASYIVSCDVTLKVVGLLTQNCTNVNVVQTDGQTWRN